MKHRQNTDIPVAEQKAFFAKGKTRDVNFRIAALRRLREGIRRREKEIAAALHADLHKSSFESYMTEIGMTLDEIGFLIRHVKEYAKPQRVPATLSQFPAKCRIQKEPYGVTLVMSPWNYPFLLALEPAAGAIAAGNCCIIKPSAYAPAVSRVIRELVEELFDPAFVAVVEGGREENSRLLEEKFDYIFFTGSVQVGKLVMKKAAEHLTPVTLELGGKTILENIAVLAEQAKENKCTDFEAEQRNLQKDIEDKKSERIRAYENYVAGHLEKDAYLQCKAELTEEINKLTERLAFFRDETDTEDGIFREVSEIREQKMFTGVNEKLTRAAVQTFIDTIYVYSADKIEITFTFDDVIERAVAYIEQHTEVPSDVG